MNKTKQYKRNDWMMVFVFLLILAGAVQTASAVTVTENTNFGWKKLIDTNGSNISAVPSSMFLSSTVSDFSVLVRQNLTFDTNKGVNYSVIKTGSGNMYIGQLYPAGHTKYRLNASVICAGSATPDSSFLFGKLIYLDILRLNSTHTKVALYYYNGTTLKTDKNYTVSGGYADTIIEYYANNATAYAWDSRTPGTVISTSYNVSETNPYDYIGATSIQVGMNNNGLAEGLAANLIIYNFEQSVPDNMITILPTNITVPFGFDGPRLNWSAGGDWLKTNNQRATIWVDDNVYWAKGGSPTTNLNATERANVQDAINNHGFELGIHFTVGLNGNATPNATMSAEMANVSSYFNGMVPKSFDSLQNADNYSHATYMYNNYGTYWRNAPNSILALSNVGNMDENTTFWWNNASQNRAFIPAFTHSVSTPPETFSLSILNFENIMGNYTSSGMSIVPYTEWYVTNMLSGANITNVYFSPTNSYFNINTLGYNATTTINDTNTGSNTIWYADSGWVITNISTSNTVNLTINTPSNQTVHKANATVVPTTYDNFTVNVSAWGISGDYLKTFIASTTTHSNPTTFTIGDFPADKAVYLLIDGIASEQNIIISNSTGWVTFTHSDYSSHTFELTTEIQDTTHSTIILSCNSAISWANIGFGMLVILLLAVGGGMALMMLVTHTFDGSVLIRYVITITLIVVIGTLGLAIVNPIVNLIGC